MAFSLKMENVTDCQQNSNLNKTVTLRVEMFAISRITYAKDAKTCWKWLGPHSIMRSPKVYANEAQVFIIHKLCQSILHHCKIFTIF